MTAPAPELPVAATLPDGRKTLLRDALFFQLKLVLDGFLDIFLAPISIAFTLLELTRGKQTTGRLFYDFLRHARRADHWIDRFGAVRHHPDGRGGDER